VKWQRVYRTFTSAREAFNRSHVPKTSYRRFFLIRRRPLTPQRRRADVIIRRRHLTSQGRRTDVIIGRRRLMSQGRHLEFTVLRRHDVAIRRRWDQFMTS